MNPSENTRHELDRFLGTLASFQSRGELHNAEEVLAGTLSSNPAVVSDARDLLRSAGRRDAMVLEGIDLLLAEMSAEDKRPARSREGRWVTVALVGVLDYPGQDALNRVVDVPALREHLAEALGISKQEVVVSGLVLSAEGAFSMRPSEVLSVSRFWRNIAREPSYQACAEWVKNHRVNSSEGRTSLQAVHLVHLFVAGDEDAATVAHELDNAFEERRSYEYRFQQEHGADTVASFGVWGCKLPWAAFQEELYLYEASHVIDLCAHMAHRWALPLNRIELRLELMSTVNGISLEATISAQNGAGPYIRTFTRLVDATRLQQRAQDMASRVGILVVAPEEVNHPELSALMHS